MAKKKRPARKRPRFSSRFRETYGRTLHNEEIRLIQGYRGLSPQQQDGLLMLVSGLVVERASDGRVLCQPVVFKTGGAK